MEPSDIEIIDAYLGGNHDMFRLLVVRYTDSIYNFVYRLGIREESDDVTQEIFIKAWKSIKKFNAEKSSFKTWLFTIARNTAIDHLRKRKLLTFSDMATDDGESNFEETLEATDDTAETLLQRNYDTESMGRMIDQLPDTYKTVLTLHYQEDMTFDAISTVMNTPINTVKSWHRRAIERLRIILENQ